MANIDKFVTVTVTQTSASVSRQGFGVPLGLFQVSTSIIPTRYAEYSTLTEMTDAGFVVTDQAYLWATAISSQDFSPVKWAIGRRDDSVATAQIATVTITTEDDGVWSVTIDGIVYSFTASSNTEQEIAEGLRDAIVAQDADTSLDGSAVVVQTGDLGSDLFTVTSFVAGDPFVNGGIVVPGAGAGTFVTGTANVVSEPIATALNAVIVENDDWYFLNIESRRQTDIEAANTWVATQVKIFVAQNMDQDVLTTTPGNIGLDLAATNNKRTHFAWYHRPKDYMDGARTGRFAAFDLDAANGVGTWAIKQLVGVVASPLTSAERDGALASGADVYITTAGRGTTVSGASVEGEFMDVQTTLDWTSSRTQEDVFTPLATSPTGVPYDDAGIAVIKAAVLGRLKIGVTNGHFSGDDPTLPKVSVPRSADVSQADKTGRILRNVVGEALLRGFIHDVRVTVNVLV